jgi:chitin disaccharide deacetylase
MQGSMAEYPIINADDFGMSASVNQAILIAFNNGWINSASLMANLPGFDEACGLLESESLRGRIGVHLNLSEGRPLTQRMAACRRFCGQDGIFRFRSASVRDGALHLARLERTAVEEELDAQIQACIAGGLQPTHLDSHLHQHNEWAIGTIVLYLAQKHGIPAIRIMRNCKQPNLPKWLYSAMYNARLHRSALARSRYFGSANEMRAILDHCREVEIMVHPQLRNGVVVDDGDVSLGEVIRELHQTAVMDSRPIHD